MKKFCLTLGLIAVLISMTPVFAAPPPPPHQGGGHISAGPHHHGHRPPPPPPRYHHRYNSGFTVYAGWNRPMIYDYYNDWYDGFYYRPRRYFPPVNTGIYIRF